jgi:threonine/homoserine/homoserine lactone efflux protein
LLWTILSIIPLVGIAFLGYAAIKVMRAERHPPEVSPPSVSRTRAWVTLSILVTIIFAPMFATVGTSIGWWQAALGAAALVLLMIALSTYGITDRRRALALSGTVMVSSLGLALVASVTAFNTSAGDGLVAAFIVILGYAAGIVTVVLYRAYVELKDD